MLAGCNRAALQTESSQSGCVDQSRYSRKEASCEVSTGEQNGNHREGMALLFFAYLTIDRKPYLTPLPSAKLPPDENNGSAHRAVHPRVPRTREGLERVVYARGMS